MNDKVDKNLHEVMEKVAYYCWECRGRPIGTPEIDWVAAERLLGSIKNDPEHDFSLCSIRPEPDEGPYRPHK